MLNKIPIVGLEINCRDLLSGFLHICRKSAIPEFAKTLARFIRLDHGYLTNSGTTSFYLILEVIKKKSKKKEVILPAYTATTLVTAVIKAGLKPVLCDISLENFALDEENLLKTISPDTLVIVCVHMFGIVVKNIEKLRRIIPADIFLIEDCAQAMGSKSQGIPVGVFGDFSLFSFNRGKNLATYGGGFIGTNSRELAEEIEAEIETLEEPSRMFKFLIPLKLLVFSLAIKPLAYGLGYAFISRFKDNSPFKTISPKKFTNFQAGVGLALIEKANDSFQQRYENGLLLINQLTGVKGIILPNISQDSLPAFNRLPFLFEDLKRKEEVEKKLSETGIETSRMYLVPLHHTFNLGYKKSEFPKAVYLSEHLLTFPVHPLVKKKDLLKIVNIIKNRSDNQ